MTEDAEQSGSSSLLARLAWDGLIPWAVALGPPIVASFSQWSPDERSAIAFVVALFACLLRAGAASHTIASLRPKRRYLARSFAMYLAIMLLLVFEIVAGLMWANNAPLIAWLAPAAMFAGYVAIISMALRPPEQWNT